MGFCFAMIPMAPLGGRQVWAVVAMMSTPNSGYPLPEAQASRAQAGNWLLVNGNWFNDVGNWLLANGSWFIDYWLLVIGYW